MHAARALRERSAVPYQWGGETLYLPEHIVEVFDDVVETLKLDEAPLVPDGVQAVEWARQLRLEAGRVERSHALDVVERTERAERLYRNATVLLAAGGMLLARRNGRVGVATQEVSRGDVLRAPHSAPLLGAGSWVVEDTWGVVSLTRLDARGRRTVTSAALKGGNVEAILKLTLDGAPLVTVERKGAAS